MQYSETEIKEYMRFFSCTREQAIEYIDYDRYVIEQEELRHFYEMACY